jgi:glutathione S-transferase
MNLNTTRGMLTAGIGASFLIYLAIVLIGQVQLAVAAMIAIIFVAFWVVVAVMIYGAKEHVETHGLAASDAPSVKAWNDRADQLDARQAKKQESKES